MQQVTLVSAASHPPSCCAFGSIERERHWGCKLSRGRDAGVRTGKETWTRCISWAWSFSASIERTPSFRSCHKPQGKVSGIYLSVLAVFGMSVFKDRPPVALHLFQSIVGHFVRLANKQSPISSLIPVTLTSYGSLNLTQTLLILKMHRVRPLVNTG